MCNSLNDVQYILQSRAIILVYLYVVKSIANGLALYSGYIL